MMLACRVYGPQWLGTNQEATLAVGMALAPSSRRSQKQSLGQASQVGAP